MLSLKRIHFTRRTAHPHTMPTYDAFKRTMDAGSLVVQPESLPAGRNYGETPLSRSRQNYEPLREGNEHFTQMNGQRRNESGPMPEKFDFGALKMDSMENLILAGGARRAMALKKIYGSSSENCMPKFSEKLARNFNRRMVLETADLSLVN
mmetsp:Transcript_4069/g.6216  ORF Transcript_4069/g.6216 Transcript_4069/m.6216 type:complete len:151 (-) Transcript_4069:167-619(-)